VSTFTYNDNDIVDKSLIIINILYYLYINILFFLLKTGAVYLFGLMSSRGEANMYPKPVQDLHGWNLRSIGTCSIGLVAAADDSCIVWGSGTSSGELVIKNFLKYCINYHS